MRLPDHRLLPLQECSVVGRGPLFKWKVARMNAQQIVDAKGHGVVTCAASATAKDVVSILSENRIGVVVVVDVEERVAGIVSERDLIRVLGRDGALMLDHPVSTVMTHPVITCDADTSLTVLMQMMNHSKIRHLPVVDHDDKPIGIISVNDVLQPHLAGDDSMRELLNMCQSLDDSLFEAVG